jgi:hypothetical protein
MTMQNQIPGPRAQRARDEWFKSRRSAGGAECVEVRYLRGGGVEMRHSKRPEGGTLIFTDAEFDAFVGGAKDGEFDR